MPRKKEQVNYAGNHVKIIYGNESFVYIKNGLVFQILGGGYVLLNVANDLLKDQSPFAHHGIARLGAGAAVFLLGEFLHLAYNPFLRIRKKYHFDYVNMQSKN